THHPSPPLTRRPAPRRRRGGDAPLSLTCGNECASPRDRTPGGGGALLLSPPLPKTHPFRFGRPSYPHRHEHIERRRILAVTHHGGRAGIGKLELRRATFELARDVEEITSVEADLERIEAVLDRQLLGGAAAIGVVDRERELAVGDGELHRAALVAR